MVIEEIKQELIEQGKNPDDFNITITENGYSITPKWFYENKQIAKKEDKPIIEDVNDVAELTTIVAMDKDELAEMLVYALQRIDELEARMNG
jgi:hypothetical protein